MVEANRILNDLDSLHRLFNSRAYYLQREIQASDVASILRKYNINVRKKTISKVTLYQEIIPHGAYTSIVSPASSLMRLLTTTQL